MSLNHLPPETLSALVDGELSPRDDAAARAHLNECHDCSQRAMEAYQLRIAVKRAAVCNMPSADALARLNAMARPVRRTRTNWMPLRGIAWQAAATLLLAAVALGGWRWMRQSNSLASEVLDQHLAVLSAASQPEVASTDRHTVKPWFEGKLPFSFNLPEANALPPDTVLTGANVAYIQGKPAALLLFTIGKHRTSVFVAQVSLLTGLPGPRTRSGFQIAEAKSANLAFLGVSDVDARELDALVRSLAAAQ